MAKALQLPHLYGMERTVEGSRNPPLAATDGVRRRILPEKMSWNVQAEQKSAPNSVWCSAEGAAFRVRAGFSVFINSANAWHWVLSPPPYSFVL